MIIGGFFEPMWVLALEKFGKAENRSGKAVYGTACLVAMIFSLFFLSLGMRTMNIGIAYAIWTAVGSVITILLSRVLMNEHFNALKVIAIMMIVAGIIGLEYAGGLA